MNSKTLVFSVTTILSASTLFAEPRVDQSAVTLEQDSQSRLVTVGYELTGEPAVITVDFQTNTLANAAGDWVSIGDVNFTNVIGDVNQVVQTGSHAIYWQPDKSWPDQRINDGRVRAVVKAWATNAPPDYCVVCLLTDAQIVQTKGADWSVPRRRYFASKEAVPGGVTDNIYKTEFLVLRKIPAAGVIWRMGPNATSWSGNPVTCKVMLTQDYYMGIYEFTGKQYGLVKGTSDSGMYPMSYFNVWDNVRGSGYPWPSVGEGYTNYTHDVASTSALGQLRSRTGIDSFDLPTEAQWEYACRAGNGWFRYNQTAYVSSLSSIDADTNDTELKKIAWCANTGSGYNTVGRKQPNDWGLYDMLGNVRELTLNWSGSYYPMPDSEGGFVTDPKGPATASSKIWRGGGAWDYKYDIFMGVRKGDAGTYVNYNNGFRVICDAVAK